MEKRIKKWESLRLDVQKFTPQECVAGCGGGTTYDLNIPSITMPDNSTKLFGWNGSCQTDHINPNNAGHTVDANAYEALKAKVRDCNMTWNLYYGSGNSIDLDRPVPGVGDLDMILVSTNSSLPSNITLAVVNEMHCSTCGSQSSDSQTGYLILQKGEPIVLPMS